MLIETAGNLNSKPESLYVAMHRGVLVDFNCSQAFLFGDDMNKKIIDLTGKRFGRLIVIEINKRNKKRREYLWKCKCDCGNITIVYGQNLRRGYTKSCGCYNKSQIIKANTKHGLANHQLYAIWNTMKMRCYNPKNIQYKDYGGRGITVCKQWRNDFKLFYDFCITNGWKKGLCIDRRNNNGNYTSSNCRFVTGKENSRNTRYSRIWIINNNKYYSIYDAAENEGVGVTTIGRWCGLYTNHKKLEIAKPGCFSYLKYKNKEKNNQK